MFGSKILLIRFKMDLKLVLTTKNRNTAMICHLFSRCRHSQNRRVENASSNQNAFVVLS